MNLRILTEGLPLSNILLEPGENTVGRYAINSVVLDHDSVSGSHCEIHLGEDHILVRDLGSTNGTFINGAPIESAVLNPGDVLRIGDIELCYDAPAEEAVTPAFDPGEEPPVPPPVRVQITKPNLPPITPSASGTSKPVRSVGPRKSRWPVAGSQPPGTFAQELPRAFNYPLRADGIILLIAGALFLLVVNIGSMVPLLGLLVAVLGGGYMLSYFQRIIVTSSQGENAMPSWPDFANIYEDILQPYLMFLGTFLFSFAPMLGYQIYGAFSDVETHAAIRWTLLSLGAFYFPMALLAVAVSDSIGTVNPMVVVPSILRVPGPYLAACVVLAATIALSVGTDLILEGYFKVPILGTLVGGVLSLYFLTVEMRILGVMYYTNRKRFGWFE